MNQKSSGQQPNNRPDSFLRYTGMAFSMAVPIGLGVYGGVKLDRYLENKVPWATIAGAVLGLSAGFYLVLKDLLRK